VKLADLPEVLAMSTREKLELMDELWLEVARDAHSLEVSAEEKKLLDERWQSFLQDPSSALTLEKLRERVKTLRA
jgi:putative addiction module component (TIGR02574 family)